MPTIDKPRWTEATAKLSEAIHGQPARLSVGALSIGMQEEIVWKPLLGLTYDPKDDLFDVQFEGVDHLVRHPRQFDFLEQAGQASSFAIIDADGAEHIVIFRDPIVLPPSWPF
jgi:hypothetical protein